VKRKRCTKKPDLDSNVARPSDGKGKKGKEQIEERKPRNKIRLQRGLAAGEEKK